MLAPSEADSPANRSSIVTVLLPAFNEAVALPVVLADVLAMAAAHAALAQFDVLVVDDGSSDDTAPVAQGFPCRLIQHPINLGKGAAIRTGIKHALGDYIVVMDADATYPADMIPEMVRRLAACDVVRCNRPADTAHMPFLNRLGNWVFDTLLRTVHGLEGSDHLSGLYGLRRDVAQRLRLESEGFDIEAEIGIKARLRGLRVDTFPIPYHPRLGEKKLNPWRDGFLILGRILALFLLHNPFQTFVLPGLLLMGLALVGAGMLSVGPVITPYFGLSIHSFMVLTLGVLAAFQLIVFGMAAALYRVEAGYKPARWLAFISARPTRLGVAALGVFMASLAGFELARLAWGWLAAGAGLFENTRDVLLASAVLVMGMQILSAALFLSIFAGRVSRYRLSELTDV